MQYGIGWKGLMLTFKIAPVYSGNGTNLPTQELSDGYFL
jgi:hypothetical protein